MSMTLTLVPVAVALSMSLGSSSLAALITLKGGEKHGFDPVETVFADGTILQKTLNEHGLCVKTLSESEYIVETEAGTLRYYRHDAQSPFLLELQNVHDMQQLLDSLDSLENEYRKNVQAFTYDRVMASLEEHGMRAESESVLDDESILLTLSL